MWPGIIKHIKAVDIVHRLQIHGHFFHNKLYAVIFKIRERYVSFVTLADHCRVDFSSKGDKNCAEIKRVNIWLIGIDNFCHFKTEVMFS